MALIKFDMGLCNNEPEAGMVDLIDCPFLVGYVGRCADGYHSLDWLTFGEHVDTIRRGDVGFFRGGPSRKLYLVVGSVDLANDVKVRVRVEYDVVTLSTSEQAALAYQCC